MRFYIMTLVSIITVLAIKSYTINAQDDNVGDLEIEMMASTELLNKADTLRHHKMISRFESSDYVYGKFAGSANFPNDTYQNYERIQRVCTVQELNKMLDHESPVVRVYAHRALMENKMMVYPHHQEELIRDSAEVLVIDGLSISKTNVLNIVAENMFQ